MAHLTPKENYLRIGYGKDPEWVPNWTMGMPGPGACATMVMPSLMGPGGFGPPIDPATNQPQREWTDQWGVTMVANEETGFAGLPKPGHFILEDVTQWKKVVKAPPYPDEFFTADWEAMAKKDLEKVDRENLAVIGLGGYGPFQQLVSFMGFTEALCALIEEPDAVKELCNYILEYYIPIVEKITEYYKPDIVMIGDDSASKLNPFFSVEIYRDIFKPIYARQFKMAFERGIPVQFHNCGRCEDFIPDMLEIGVRFWDPAQTKNDILGIKQKYKGKLAVCGAFDYVPPPSGEITEEDIRSQVRGTLDKFAPGGGYAFCGGILGRAGDMEQTMKINGWVQDEVVKYGAEFYK